MPVKEEVIRNLNVHMPGTKEWPASLATRDDVAEAVRLRRLGYVFDWTRIANLDVRRRHN